MYQVKEQLLSVCKEKKTVFHSSFFRLLGMVPEHSHVEQYSVTDFSRRRRAVHKSILRERKLLPPSSSSCK